MYGPPVVCGATRMPLGSLCRIGKITDRSSLARRGESKISPWTYSFSYASETSTGSLSMTLRSASSIPLAMARAASIARSGGCDE